MSKTSSKRIRSPRYPFFSLPVALSKVGEIELQYRSSIVDRVEAAKLIGYSTLSGPANQALAALTAYGLTERAGKGDIRVTKLAQAILHPDSPQEYWGNLVAAASSPSLFRELNERFPDISIPPEDGVSTFLNRRGFNPNVVRRAARAYLDTAKLLEEKKVSDDRKNTPYEGIQSHEPTGDPTANKAKEARIGDYVQWESQGELQFPEPLRIRHVSEDGEWVFVDGSETGIPMSEVVVVESPDQKVAPPTLPLSTKTTRETEWMRNRVGKETSVRLMVSGDMGPKEIQRLIRVLQTQHDILVEDEDM